MSRPTIVPIDAEDEQQRLKEESEKARQSRSAANLSAEIVARSKRHPEKKELPGADDK